MILGCRINILILDIFRKTLVLCYGPWDVQIDQHFHTFTIIINILSPVGDVQKRHIPHPQSQWDENTFLGISGHDNKAKEVFLESDN